MLRILLQLFKSLNDRNKRTFVLLNFFFGPLRFVFEYPCSSILHFADMRPTFLSMFKNVFLPQRIDAFRDEFQRMPADASVFETDP